MTPRNISACAECGGTGKISYRTPSGDSVTTADGVTITDMGGYSTRPCACVKDLPVIVGHASWWTSESVYTETVPIPIGNEAVEITADCEVPRAENGRRLFRTAENAYYPPLVDVTTERDHLTLHADTWGRMTRRFEAYSGGKAKLPAPALGRVRLGKVMRELLSRPREGSRAAE